MTTSYWNDRILRNRLTRRRVLAAGTAVTSVAALSLMGCGGGSSKGQSSGSGLLTKPVDATKQAKPGGTWPLMQPNDPPNIDPLSTVAFQGDYQGYFVYSRPLKYKVGTIADPPKGETEGDAFESWELSPDNLTLTFKLRQGLKWEPQAPVNGRDVTIDDVNFSWDKFSAMHVARASFLNSLNPDAPILSMQTPDARTIVYKLKTPYAPIISMFATNRGIVIQPREAADKFDPRKEMHGSGPWMLTKFTPSVGFEYKRNPNWYVKDRPFMDISRPIIQDYSQQLAQFESGNLWQFDPKAEDILTVKKNHPGMLLLVTGWSIDYPLALSFDWKPNSPFRDVRLRRAMSMLVDRDLYIDTFNGVAKYQDEGIDLPTRWHSHFSAGDERYWLDPKTSKLGEGSQYFKFDPAEAKKLIQAAGRDGLQFPMRWTGGTNNDRSVQVFAQMFQQNGGLNPTLQPLTKNERDIQCHTGGGTSDGICADLSSGSGVDIDVWLDTRVHYGGSPYVPYTEPLPIIDELCKAQKTEFDEKKRTDMILQIEKQMAVQMVSIPMPGLAETNRLTWPWLANFGYVQNIGIVYTPSEAYVHYWYDESKRTA